MGDYNIDLLQPTHFHDILLSNSLHPHINKPTRINNNTHSKTLIDNILSNVITETCTNGILYSDISDHLPIFMIKDKSVTTPIRRQPKQYLKMYRNETPQNIDSLNQDLFEEQWDDVFELQDVDSSYEIFFTKIIRLL